MNKKWLPDKNAHLFFPEQIILPSQRMFAVPEKGISTMRYIAIRMAVVKHEADGVIGLLKTLQRLTIAFRMTSEV